MRNLFMGEEMLVGFYSLQVTDNEFTKSRNVTLRNIMSHTAGLNVPTFPGYSQEMDVPSITEILRGVSPANTEPIHVGWLPGKLFQMLLKTFEGFVYLSSQTINFVNE